MGYGSALATGGLQTTSAYSHSSRQIHKHPRPSHFLSKRCGKAGREASDRSRCCELRSLVHHWQRVTSKDIYSLRRTAMMSGGCRYKGILGSLSEGEKGKLQRSMGLKIEQLKVGHLHIPRLLLQSPTCQISHLPKLCYPILHITIM